MKSTSVKVQKGDLVLPTYLPAPPDKNPMFLEKRVYQGSSGKVYPLPFTDRIAEKLVSRKWKAVWIENEFLRVLILPEIGGRIHAILDKTNGYDLIYNQPVIKPALVGLAGPWISGGIEFNWPQHHRPATFLPVNFGIEKHAGGSATVWCSDHDPMCRMKGMHGVCLHPGCAYVELKVRAYNRTPFTQTFLWWANVATRVHEAYQSFFPPDVHCVADHARRSMSEYPLAQGFYGGVNYGERGRKDIPQNEIPKQFIPPHAGGNAPVNYAPNDLSFYANIPTPCSYMCMGSENDFFGGYDHKAQAGIVHIANHHISPGKKQWTWGNQEFGYAWDRNLTERDTKNEFGPYIEIMAGVYTDNQPDFSFLQPGETKTWSQYWYPIQKIGPAQHANLDAAIHLQTVPGKLRLGVSVTRQFSPAQVQLTARGKKIFSKVCALAPGRPFVAEIAALRGVPETDVRLRVCGRDGREIISYQPTPRTTGKVPPPATEPPAPRDMASADELFITGLHLDQYRHATRCPTLYWREALRRDPRDARCNNALGLWHLKRGEFAKAEKHFRSAIERLTRRNANPAEGEPYYNLGLCLRHLGRDDEAYAAFYKACWNQTWMAAGYHALAEIDCCRQHWPAALDLLNRSLRFNTDNLRARNLKVLVLRRLAAVGQALRRSQTERKKRETAAMAILRETLALDPLDWWAQYLSGGKLACDLQTALDLAHDLARAGFYTEAMDLLEATPGQTSGSAASRISKSVGATKNPRPADLEIRDTADLEARATTTLPDQSWGALPLVHYTLGWMHEKLEGARASARFNAKLHGGRGSSVNAARQYYRAAAALPPDYCFPSRLEEIAILEAAMRANPRDAKAPYYLGNLLYDRRRHEEAIQLWENSAKLNPHFSIVWRNLGIGYFNVRGQPAQARAAYERAFRTNPKDGRLLFERDQLWKRLGEKLERRLRELEQHRDLVQQRDDLSVEFCALLNQTGRHVDAMQLLAARSFQPWEGGEGGPLRQHVRTQLALGREALVQSDFPCAVSHFENALAAPQNLGEAKHLLANQSDIHYWFGCALAAGGERQKARNHWLVAATFKGDFQEMSVRAFSEMTYYSALAMEKLGQRAKARKLFRDLLAYAQRLQKMPAKIDYFATSLPTMLLFDDDLQFRQQTTALFLQAQGQLGLGNNAKGRALLRAVLRRDPSHALASDLMKEP